MRGRRRPRNAGDPLLVGCASLAAFAATVFLPSAAAHDRAPYWSHSRVMSRIDGARLAIGGWSQRVQRESTLCSGDGRPRRWSGVPHWKHFVCTWTVFSARGAIDRDVTFHVHTLTPRRFLITNPHFGAS
jgi:hypothetical protein